MAEVLVKEGETIEEAVRRFKERVNREGNLGRARQHLRFASKAQKKRAKRMLAQKRNRRLVVDEEPDIKPWCFDTEWPIRMDTPPAVPNKQNWILDGIQEEPGLPSAFVAGIAEYRMRAFRGIIIIKDKQKRKYTFPGGGTEKNERPESAIVREFREETGLIIEMPTPADIIFQDRVVDHQIIFYKVRVVGGMPKVGEEIEDLLIKNIESLRDFAAQGGLSSNHRLAFSAYYERRGCHVQVA